MTTRSGGVRTPHGCGQRHFPLLPLALLVLGNCERPDPTEPVRLELTPPHAIIAVGGTIGLTVKVLQGDDVLPATPVAWSSSDPAVVEVDATGTVRGRAPGFGFVRAAALGASAEAGIGVDVQILVGAGDIGDCDKPNDEATAALLDPLDGTRQFVVGTGGGQLLDLFDVIEANSEVRNNNTAGVLVLILHPARYEWRFLPAVGTFTDSGSADCH